MFFVAKNITASRVNLNMNDFVAGIPSPLAFIGLAESISRDLGLENWSSRVMPVIHDVQISAGRTVAAKKNIKANSFSPIEIPEDLIGIVNFSIILDLPGCDSAKIVRQSLVKKRLAGGNFQNLDIEIEKISDISHVLGSLKRGYLIMGPTEERAKVTTLGDYKSLESLADVLYGDDKLYNHIPVAIGYRLLEDPNAINARSGVRDKNIPHVFVEPVAGIAETVSVRSDRLKELSEDSFRDLMWFWNESGDYIFGNRSYL